jgi:hypothetical protein
MAGVASLAAFAAVAFPLLVWLCSRLLLPALLSFAVRRGSSRIARVDRRVPDISLGGCRVRIR